MAGDDQRVRSSQHLQTGEETDVFGFETREDSDGRVVVLVVLRRGAIVTRGVSKDPIGVPAGWGSHSCVSA